jgi:spore maturation protein CgeB
MAGLDIAFFGSSLVSAYWNGAATYYRGLIRALAERGHRTTFYEPDAFGRQARRDIDDPPWARVVVYEPTEDAASRCLEEASRADVVVKASGVGVLDAFLEAEAARLSAPGRLSVFWDVDAPATLARAAADPADPFRALVPRFDMVLTYGGGPPVVQAYRMLGARSCTPICNAVDPATHRPEPPHPDLACDLLFLGNRLPDREERVGRFFLEPASRLPGRSFLIGGAGWEDKAMPANVRRLGHVYTADHNRLNRSALAVLNVARDSMAAVGWSPATRVFEAAGAGACVLTDAWEGVADFFEPGAEILVAEDGEDVARILADLTPSRSAEVGAAALRRALAEHTYARRAAEAEAVLTGARAAAPARGAA